MASDLSVANLRNQTQTSVCKEKKFIVLYQSVSSVTQSCLTLCDPMDCSMPGFPVHHQLLELAQTHFHQVGAAIQLSHPLLSPSPPAFNLSQQTGSFHMSQFFTSGGQSFGVSALASALPMNFRFDFL